MHCKFINITADGSQQATPLIFDLELEPSVLFKQEIKEILRNKDFYPKKSLLRLDDLLTQPYCELATVYDLKLEILTMLKRIEEAAKLFGEITNQNLDSAKTYYRYALLHFHHNDYQKAIEVASEARHTSKELRLLIFRSLYSAGKKTEAKNFLAEDPILPPQEKLLAKYETALVTDRFHKQQGLLKELEPYGIRTKHLPEPLKVPFTDHFYKMCDYHDIDLDMVVERLKKGNFKFLRINDDLHYLYLLNQKKLYKIVLKRDFCITIFKELDISGWPVKDFNTLPFKKEGELAARF